MKTIGIYPGNYQPPTRAHLHTYKLLKQIVGTDTFIVTTDRTPTPDAPLNFGDKEQILVRSGIPASHVVKVQNWKHPVEVFNNFSPTHTVAIFALNHKESEEFSKRKVRAGQIIKESNSDDEVDDDTDVKPSHHENREIWIDVNGKPGYFQPYKGNERLLKPISEHVYVLIVDDTRIEGKPISTANIRQIFGSTRYNDDEKKKFFRFIFGWFDIGLYTLMTSKFRLAHQSFSAEEEPAAMPSMSSLVKSQPNVDQSIQKNKKVKSKIQQMVKEILGEIMDEDYSSTSISTSSTPNATSGMDDSPSQQRANVSKQKADLNKQKAQANKELDTLKKDLKWKESDVLMKRKYDLKNKQAQIDDLNKQLAQPSTTSTSTITSMS